MIKSKKIVISIAILSVIVAIFFVSRCTSNANFNNISLLDKKDSKDMEKALSYSSAIEQVGENIYYYESTNTGFVLYQYNLSTKEKTEINKNMYCSTFSIIDNRLYYAMGEEYNKCTIYSINLDKIEDGNTIEAKLEDKDYTTTLSALAEENFKVIKIEDKIYALVNKAVYQLENGEPTFITDGIVSITTMEDGLYYSDNNGNIFKYDYSTKVTEDILPLETLMNSGQYIKIFSDTINTTCLIPDGDNLFFIATGKPDPYGRIYRYNMKTKELPTLMMNFSGTTHSYKIYDKKIYYYNDSTHSLDYIDCNATGDEYTSLNIHTSLFNIFNNKLYYLTQTPDNEFKYFVMDLKKQNRELLFE